MRNQNKHTTHPEDAPTPHLADPDESNDVFTDPGEVGHGETSRFRHPEFKIEFDKDYPILGTRPEEAPTTTQEPTTQDETTVVTTTTQEVDTEPTPSQVVSVRVSSSVVRSRPEKKRTEEETPPEKTEQETSTEEAATLIVPEQRAVLTTEDRPTVTAVQRSQFGVEEPQRSVTYDANDKVVTYSEEHTVYRVGKVEGRQAKSRAEEATTKEDVKPEDSVAEASQDYRAEDNASGRYGKPGYPAAGDPQKAPVSYRTSVSSATSGSSVQFYRGPPAAPGESRSPKNYELPERVYGRPEQNYEVDEAVSVVTNGRTHGVQEATEKTRQEEAAEEGGAEKAEGEEGANNHKFGYVVEGRNYRKYRVEERTPDGFIVGEYGVVSHNDGTLRGVRYTADRGVNPRLIYQALVKFLSLH
ncbi:hypothetical protein AAG570_005867 [Ranatra chinensis]|uniref:Uncharacterized protein n=1 Tax=Ranatra chinensis TaxID=642074 RepID=A0ABD0XWD3_9HEMI